MGWNDISGIFNIAKSKMSKLKALFFLLLPVFIFIAGFSVSHSAPKKSENSNIEYRPSIKFPEGVKHEYKMTEKTDVVRVFSDSSKRQYSRLTDYYITILPLGAERSGFTKLVISVDSIYYRLTEGDAVFEYNSNSDSMSNFSLKDVQSSIIPLGKTFEILYSPYTDIAEFGGEQIEWLNNYIKENMNDLSDKNYGLMWLDGISLDRLGFIGDVKKIMLPVGNIDADSVWRSPFSVQIDKITYFDTIYVKVASFKNKTYTISSEIKSLTPSGKEYYQYGIINPTHTDSCLVESGIFNMEIAPRGTLRKVNLDISLKAYMRSGTSRYTDFITQKNEWVLLRQWAK
jgi:hypothetical protein